MRFVPLYAYLLGLAHNINVPVEEIELAAMDYPIDEHEAFYDTAVQYYCDQNISLLSKLTIAIKITNTGNQIKSQSKPFPAISISIR
jgi:hypothetical protein